MKHTVILEKRTGANIGRLILRTEDGPCPGNTVLAGWRKVDAAFEERAYVLAKQIGASSLEGVSDHVMGFWLTWQAANA